MKTALVTGILGQDGQYLSEYLLSLGYRVCGLARREPSSKVKDIEIFYGDLRDKLAVETAIWKAWPDEIYNLAGQVFVPVSWHHPQETFAVNTGGLATILEVVERLKPDIKVYQASSSEMYGNQDGSCDEACPFLPTSPYGLSKLAAHRLVQMYRDKGLFVVGGILFNHESPRRGPEMVTRKITRAVAAWKLGSVEKLVLGDLTARRDWGFAGDYVKAMHMMLQQCAPPKDFVIGTGVSRSVQEFLEAALSAAGLPIERHLSPYYLATKESLRRDNEIKELRANRTLAAVELSWQPDTPFATWVQAMVDSDIEHLSRLNCVHKVRAS